VPASHPARHARAARAAEELGWTDVLASISDGVLVLDADGIVDDCNPAAELLAGISASQAIGRPAAHAFGPRATNRWIVDLVHATLREGVTHRRSEEILWSSGHEVVVGAACAPILDPTGALRGAVLVLHDLTLQRAVDTASRQADRLAALDRVAAGLAHEIRNPLGGIKGAAQLLRAELDDPGHRQCTDLIIREVERLAGLVDRLRDLGSPPPLAVEAVNIHRVLRDVLTLERQTPAWGTIAVVTEFDPSLPAVAGDAAQLHQVFLNLVRNAAEALGGRGTITLATRMDAAHRVRPDGGRIRFLTVSIADSGPGIPEADVPHIFAPFFSTRSRGSGLGLALCQRIATQHGGTLVYDPPAAGGARFRVTLPVSDTHDDRDR
jgi:two-component system nitrogen regulation sensor histidine kinase GlnL